MCCIENGLVIGFVQHGVCLYVDNIASRSTYLETRLLCLLFESVPETNQYQAIGIKFLVQENNGKQQRLIDYK